MQAGVAGRRIANVGEQRQQLGELPELTARISVVYAAPAEGAPACTSRGSRRETTFETPSSPIETP